MKPRIGVIIGPWVNRPYAFMTLPQACATCGKSLEDRQPPTCPRCKTLYCGSDCQRADWKAGHKKICKAIAEEGGAAQRHANEKAAEAVAALLKERAAPAKTACRLCKKTTSDEFVAVWCEKCQTKDRLAHASCLAKYAARVAVWNQPALCEYAVKFWISTQARRGRRR